MAVVVVLVQPFISHRPLVHAPAYRWNSRFSSQWTWRNVALASLSRGAPQMRKP